MAALGKVAKFAATGGLVGLAARKIFDNKSNNKPKPSLMTTYGQQAQSSTPTPSLINNKQIY